MPSLALDLDAVVSYASASQRARVLSEHWTHKQIYCPNCGRAALEKDANNKPVSAFRCPDCCEVYELKSQKSSFGRKLVDGAYGIMVKRLEANDNPNLFLLSYSLQPAQVINFSVVPKRFLVPSFIEKRPPLALTARRAGWIGCNILLQDIPHSGCIGVIEAGIFRSKSDVLADRQKVLFVRESRRPDA